MTDTNEHNCVHACKNFILLYATHMQGHYKYAGPLSFACSILTSVDSDEPVQPPLKLINSK